MTLQQVGPGSAQKCAYTAAVNWPPDRIRREREARGWSQRKLRDAIVASSPDGKLSLRAVTAWEAGESKPSGRNLAALDRVLAAEEPAANPLEHVDDLELLAEVAKRMAAGRSNNHGYQPITTPGANQALRWDVSDMPSTKRADETETDPDAKDARA